MTKPAWPPYELVDKGALAAARDKSRRLERLYHLTHEHAWDGPSVFGGLVDAHGAPGRDMKADTRRALLDVSTLLLWGELAAWNISADLALGIEDADAKMAATAQVFDEARHFYVLRDYVLALAADEPLRPLGGIARRLLTMVLEADTLAKKLVGMQLLFETNAVVMFRRIAEQRVCPILSELLPYFERDESRHVGLGVLYLPRLIERMDRAEAAATVAFHARCLTLLIGGGFVLREQFETLGLDPRLMSTRVTAMQDDVVRQMVAAHGRGVARAVLNPRASNLGPRVIDFVHPEGGLDSTPAWHRAVHGGLTRVFQSLDRALA